MLSGINQTSQMASLLFSKLDTRSQGYLEQSDLTTAFSQIASKVGENSSSAEEVFSALDSNSDGKVTKDEFASVLEQLQQQLGSGHMHGMGGMPPPPPAENDAGFTKEELTSQLESIGSSDSQRSSLISKVVDNFEAADADGDGKVSFKEAMAYDQSTQSAASTSDSSAQAASTQSGSEAQLLMKIMQLVHAYGVGQDQENSGVASLLSVSA